MSKKPRKTGKEKEKETAQSSVSIEKAQKVQDKNEERRIRQEEERKSLEKAQKVQEKLDANRFFWGSDPDMCGSG